MGRVSNRATTCFLYSNIAIRSDDVIYSFDKRAIETRKVQRYHARWSGFVLNRYCHGMFASSGWRNLRYNNSRLSKCDRRGCHSSRDEIWSAQTIRRCRRERRPMKTGRYFVIIDVMGSSLARLMVLTLAPACSVPPSGPGPVNITRPSWLIA